MTTLHHVAIIPDGNRRWAREHGRSVLEGHKKGAETMLALFNKAKELHIQIGSFWCFSTENWNRARNEVEGLMGLFDLFLKKYSDKLIEHNVRFHHIGKKDSISNKLASHIANLEEKTRKFHTHHFVLGLDYGGRNEMIRAIHFIQKQRVTQLITENEFENFLDTKNLPFPNPDLIIRTGGEKRLSGFMSWQSAYSELMFVKKFFPDFSPKDLEKCVKDYYQRQRRFGK